MGKRVLCIFLVLTMMPFIVLMSGGKVFAANDKFIGSGAVKPLEGEIEGETIEAFPQVVQWGEELSNIGFRVWIDKDKGEFENVSDKWMWDQDYAKDTRLETLGKQWFCAVECDSSGKIKVDGEVCDVMIEVKQRVPKREGVSYNLSAYIGSTLGSLVPQLGMPKDINDDPLNGEWSWLNSTKGKSISSDTILNEAGKDIKKYEAKFTPADSNYSARNYKVSINVSELVSETDSNVAGVAGDLTGEENRDELMTEENESWGEEVTEAGQTMYVATDGTVSAEVTKDGVIWLREDAGGNEPWYGLDNSDGKFEKGSRFWVRWIHEKEEFTAWDELYEGLKKGNENIINKEKLSIFLTGVTSPDGKEYTNIQGSASMYIQPEKDWDKDNIKAMFIGVGDSSNEPVDVNYKGSMQSPEGEREFAILSLKHFSPYAFYEEKNDNEVVTHTQKKESNSYGMIAFLGGVIALGIIVAVIILKRRKA